MSLPGDSSVALRGPTREEVERAAVRLEGVLRRVPLVPHHRDPSLLLKPEILQPTGSFKLRGVFHAVSRVAPERRARGLRTVSAGNTAKALAWCGRHFGVPASSLMPEHAPRTKVDAVRRLGGTPELVPVAEVFRFLREEAWRGQPEAFIHPWIERDVMIGHGTLALEVLHEAPDLDTVFLPVGGGGLCAGVAATLKAQRPELRVVAVEPAGCPALHRSLELGRPAEVECHTLCDGVAVPYITEAMFPLLASLVDDCVLVEESQVRAAIRDLALGNHMVAEGAGALTLAAALAVPESERGQSLVPVTGGSIDRPDLARILRGDDVA